MYNIPIDIFICLFLHKQFNNNTHALLYVYKGNFLVWILVSDKLNNHAYSYFKRREI